MRFAPRLDRQLGERGITSTAPGTRRRGSAGVDGADAVEGGRPGVRPPSRTAACRTASRRARGRRGPAGDRRPAAGLAGAAEDECVGEVWCSWRPGSSTPVDCLCQKIADSCSIVQQTRDDLEYSVHGRPNRPARTRSARRCTSCAGRGLLLPLRVHRAWGMTLPPMPGYLWFHVVTAGRCWLEAPDGTPRRWPRRPRARPARRGPRAAQRARRAAPGILDL